MLSSVPECAKELGGEGNSNSLPPSNNLCNPAKNWCFTFNNYEVCQISLIINKLDEIAKLYIFQEEICPTTNTPHLQGQINFKDKVRPKGIFDKLGCDKMRFFKTKDIKKSIEYCCKKESRAINGGIWSNFPIPRPLDLMTEFQPWHNDIINIISDNPNPRTIHWFWEPNGGTEKSRFAKYLAARKNAIILCGKASDMKNGIMMFEKTNSFFPDIIIIDIPRCFDTNFLSYQGIEEIKNGCFFSPKYEGGMCIFNNPHMFIFANKPPDKSKLSQDRWNIVEIE